MQKLKCSEEEFKGPSNFIVLKPSVGGPGRKRTTEATRGAHCVRTPISRLQKNKWTDLNPKEFQKFCGLNFYFALVRLSTVQSYWKTGYIFSLTLPASVMPRNKYLLSWNVHMSDPERDVENDKKKGKPEHERLFPLNPTTTPRILKLTSRWWEPRLILA